MTEKVERATRWWELDELPPNLDEESLRRFVYFALTAGKTEPLAKFLRLGYDLNDDLRHEIANMLSGCAEEWQLVPKNPGHRGPGSNFSEYLTAGRDNEIGEYIASRLAVAGKLESALTDAVSRYGYPPHEEPGPPSPQRERRSKADREIMRHAWKVWRSKKK
jgi:hypothetical protein